MFDFQSLIKYILEGFAVALAAYAIPQKRVDPQEIAVIALVAAAVFAVLDQFAPAVASGARQGAGFGIGFRQVNFEGFEDDALPDVDVDVDATQVPKCIKNASGQCTYAPSMSKDDRSRVLCKPETSCKAVNACKMGPEGQCVWENDTFRQHADASGMSCQGVDVNGKRVCQMRPDVSEDNDIEGFEGFSKVF